MTGIENSKLLLLRVQKAISLINHLRDENRELSERYSLVEQHNRELQELIEKVSADQAVIEQAIASAIEELDSTFGDLDDFGTMDAEELEAAEDFSVGEDDFEDSFEEESFDDSEDL